VLEQGAREREVVLPPGVWLGADGKRYVGPERATVRVPIDVLCFFERSGAAHNR